MTDTSNRLQAAGTPTPVEIPPDLPPTQEPMQEPPVREFPVDPVVPEIPVEAPPQPSNEPMRA